MALRLEQNELAQFLCPSEALQILNDTAGLPRWWKADILLTLGKIASAQGRLSARKIFKYRSCRAWNLYRRRPTSPSNPFCTSKSIYQRSYAHILNNHIPSNFKKIKSFPVGTKVNIKKEDILPFLCLDCATCKTIKDDRKNRVFLMKHLMHFNF